MIRKFFAFIYSAQAVHDLLIAVEWWLWVGVKAEKKLSRKRALLLVGGNVTKMAQKSFVLGGYSKLT